MRLLLVAALCALVGGFDSSAQAVEPAWKEVAVPDEWKKAPAGEHGHLWYRAKVSIPAAWRTGTAGQASSGTQRKLELVVEAVDDAREFYFNGQKIGGLGDFPPAYRSGLGETKRLAIPGSAIKHAAENVVAIRVCTIESRNGFNVAAPVLFAGDSAIRLAGKWETANGDDMAWAASDPTAIKTAAFSKIERVADVERELKKLSDEDRPLSPQESFARMKTPADLQVELVLSEPHIGQPLSLKWDHRGRLWVMNYLQYPSPAGLTMVSRDKFLRSVYDQIPPPPPNHFRGADKITIHEDTDGDGALDKHSTFLEGLSLASSFEFGRGGIWVLNPPYLLFYPDANGDDVPDGDPVVHLEGFGIEDSHSITNNLRLGPDGWLYATQGSTVTGDVRLHDSQRQPGDKSPPVHSLGQLVWRYHPELKKYEIFAEGGGNAFGVEIDAKGRVFSGHNGPNTRGFHYVQGGYLQKGFGKHGELSNPYTFGYFEAMGHHNVPRFSHTFVIYEATALPEAYRGRLFGVVPLLSHVVMSQVEPDRSSFKTKDVGYALETTDPWFRPVDIQVGPDGAIYVADMYEQRIDHASHYQGRIHKESGRIYRLRAEETNSPPRPKFDLRKELTVALPERLTSDDKWMRQATQREFLNREDKPFGKTLLLTITENPQIYLEMVWAANALGAIDDRETISLLDYDDPYVRLWAVRLACDDGQISPEIAEKLADLAYREPHVEVRSQLACSARRLPAAQSLPIVKNLCQRSEDAADIHIPLLLWWAIEAKADKDRDAVLALFADKAFWEQPLVKGTIVERLMRRYAATGQRKDLVTCARLLELAPNKELAGKLMTGLEAAYEGRTLANLPDELVAAMSKAGATSPTLRLRQGDAPAVAEALQTLADESADASKRQSLAVLFGTINQPSCVPVLLELVKTSRNDSLRAAALAALQAYGDPAIGPRVISLYRDMSDQVRETAQSLLASRKAWAEEFLSAIDGGKVEAASVSESTVRKLLLHDSPRIAELCKKHWGELTGPSPDALRAEIEKMIGVIGSGSGNPYQGKQLFTTSCGKCHILFAQGGKIGPDLTGYKRDDLRGMLLNVVHPSAEIREGFENYIVRTVDGRTLTGFIADQDANVIVLRGADGHNLSLPRDEIGDLRASRESLMPAGQLKQWSDQQVRDLFAYLRATQPLP
ncbi:MAG: c-type cytochrome [Planctomycetaceae bacterium]|nr:c-type cytochrome [Planctomycetaceae bacterium]